MQVKLLIIRALAGKYPASLKRTRAAVLAHREEREAEMAEVPLDPPLEIAKPIPNAWEEFLARYRYHVHRAHIYRSELLKLDYAFRHGDKSFR